MGLGKFIVDTTLDSWSDSMRRLSSKCDDNDSRKYGCEDAARSLDDMKERFDDYCNNREDDD